MSARTLPVTPAERACATVLRAWLEWQPSPEDDASKEALACMFDFGGSLRANDFVTRGQATPAGAALLARVEAAERTPRPMPAYLASFPQGPGAPAPIVPRLSERARKALAALSLAEPRDFARLTWLDLLRVDGCGTKTRAELLQWAGEHGAHLIHRLPKRERDALASKEPAQ